MLVQLREQEHGMVNDGHKLRRERGRERKEKRG